MRAWLVVSTLLGWFVAAPGWALDDTSPTLRWGVMGGLSGSQPLGDLRAPAATRDEFARALWIDLEPLQFDIGAHLNLSPVARFVLRGGVDGKALDAALDPARRTDAMGKPLDEPRVSALELGVKGRYFPWGAGRWRPYLALGLGYTTLGAGYEARAAAAAGAGGPAGGASTQLRVHRHQGLATRLGLGLRYDVPLRLFNTDMLAPIALELSYTHNTWLGLARAESVETNPGVLVGRRPFVDYVGVSLTLGFLR